jgi:serum/glucocorticoid-regulated kinase 2
VARVFRSENSDDTSGTPGYMAPEVLHHMNHSYQADFFAVGVIAHECMLGKRPYFGKTRNDIREAIRSKRVDIDQSMLPRGWSMEAADFIC